MPFTIVRQDITKMKTDAIVNAANTQLAMGGGVCGAIFSAAGVRELEAACRKLVPIRIGEAVITPGFGLPAKFIIHAAGPVYCPEHRQESEKLLRSAYTSALRLAVDNHCESVAFPLISSGIYGYPKAEALQAATSAIRVFLENHDLDVYLAVFDKTAYAVSRELLGDVQSYLDEHYAQEREDSPRRLLQVEEEYLLESAAPCKRLEIFIPELDEPFSATLLRLIDAKGKSDVEVYKRANLDRKLFSKIRAGKGYMPGKRTILALAVALELSLGETEDLLKRAGYALSPSQKFDVIVEYFIVNGQYDIFGINEVLFQYDQPLLGGF